MATIRIADDAHPRGRPLRQAGSNEDVPVPTAKEGIYRMNPLAKHATTSSFDGIYNIRSVSRVSTDRHSIRSSKQDEIEDDDPGLRRPEDYKTRQVYNRKMILWLAYQSIGVIYGDIGTSPLYVYSSTFTKVPAYQDLVEVLSVIIWSLTMMVTVKYVLVILRADNEGEGGTFSTYSLLSRYANITNRDPREASFVQIKRFRSGDLESTGRQMRQGLERSKTAKIILKVMGVFAVTMVLSDGVLTPAQSVLGAVQGIQVVHPTISKATIVGVTDAILILLFMVQPLGITKISFAFSPVVMIWLAFNAVFGIYNLAKFDHTVLKAFNPGCAFQYLIRHKTEGWKSLGGILLAFTGVEALFADLGAFNRKAIQLSWLCYTFPCLLLAYIGQAAYISVHPSAYSNPFFNAAPPGTIYPALIIAILAAIVASQAIITATFQLLAQVMKLSYFPQIKVVHTSKIFHGQLYVPMMNWLLMTGTVLVASIFNNTTSLGNAYGVCVMFVTFFDTCMVSLAAIFVWRIPPYFVFFPWLTIACLDGTYISSALTKVPNGAWFTLTLASVLACIFLLWRYGKEQQWLAEAEDRFPTSHFVKQGDNGQLQLTKRYGGESLSVIKGFGVFFDKAGETTPLVFSHFAIKVTAITEVMVFFHLRPLERPSVPPEDRYAVSRLAIPNCYRLIVRHGYNDVVITPDLASLIVEQIRHFVISDGTSRKPTAAFTAWTSTMENGIKKRATITLPPNADGQATDATKTSSTAGNNNNTIENTEGSTDADEKGTTGAEFSNDLAKLEAAYSHKVLYIVGKEQLKIRAETNIFRKLLLRIFLWARDNTRAKIANLRIPTDKLVEVGFVKEV